MKGVPPRCALLLPMTMPKEHFPCLLLLNDIHISKDNIPEFTANWDEALDICHRMDVHEIALGGDLFLSRAAQSLDVLLAVHDALLSAAECGIRVVLAEGNHDKVDQESPRGYCHVFDQHPNVLVADDFLSLPAPEGQRFVLHMIGYWPEDGSFCDKLQTVTSKALVPEKFNFLYIHEGINGALSQPGDKELPANIFGDFDKVFVGHYHNRCIISGTRIEYIGSSRQHNFGEDEEKGYTLLYNDGEHEFIRNRANTRYRTLDVPFQDAGIHLADRLEELRAEGRCKVRVRVHCSPDEAAGFDRSKLLEAGASKVEVTTEEMQPTKITSTELFERYDKGKIRECYESFCRERRIEDPELGIIYLSQIDGTCGN